MQETKTLSCAQSFTRYAPYHHAALGWYLGHIEPAFKSRGLQRLVDAKSHALVVPAVGQEQSRRPPVAERAFAFHIFVVHLVRRQVE